MYHSIDSAGQVSLALVHLHTMDCIYYSFYVRFINLFDNVQFLIVLSILVEVYVFGGKCFFSFNIPLH